VQGLCQEHHDFLLDLLQGHLRAVLASAAQPQRL
jgi:hypothetical protein